MNNLYMKMNNWLRCIEKEGSSPDKPSEENLLHASSFNKSSENVVFLFILIILLVKIGILER